MEYRRLGNSGLRVSVAGLGTNNFGPRCDLESARAVVREALELGVNFFDTADFYGRGVSEEYLGKALEGRRHEVVIATKFRYPMGEGPLWEGASRRYIMRAVQASLRRLNTDYIDLYQIHAPDPATPIEETLRALDDLVRRGDILYLGCSNFTAWEVVEAQWTARAQHLEPLVSAQNPYNLLDRRIERELVPACRKYGLGIIPYTPLARGFLTGKYRPGQPPPQGTRLATPSLGGRYLTAENFAVLARLEAFAAERGHSVGELALAWLASQPCVSTVIAGAMSPEQVTQNVRALEWRLTPDDLHALDETLNL